MNAEQAQELLTQLREKPWLEAHIEIYIRAAGFPVSDGIVMLNEDDALPIEEFLEYQMEVASAEATH